MTELNTVPEEFLHFIWENKLFDSNHLYTTEGELVEIIHTGYRNHNSGPDFFNAKVKIAGTIWAGNIEIHKKASDWHKHNHTNDKAYSNVILHAVEKADIPILRDNLSEIPTVELFWPSHLTRNYNNLLKADSWICC